jgi:hypothetical protein
MTERVTITLPLPPRSLSPNGREHWTTKNRDAQQFRFLARNATNHHASSDWPWPGADCLIIWHYSGRQPDDDNVIAQCKSIRDGVADAELVTDDRHIKTIGVEFVKVRKVDECVILHFDRRERP